MSKKYVCMSCKDGLSCSINDETDERFPFALLIIGKCPIRENMIVHFELVRKPILVKEVPK